MVLKLQCASKSPGGFVKTVLGLPGVSVVKNPPAEAGDMGPIPDPGRSHKLRSNEAHVPQTIEPML